MLFVNMQLHFEEKKNLKFPEYYRALKAGEFCRMAEEWLLSDASGYRVSSSYESLPGQFTRLKYLLITLLQTRLF